MGCRVCLNCHFASENISTLISWWFGFEGFSAPGEEEVVELELAVVWLYPEEYSVSQVVSSAFETPESPESSRGFPATPAAEVSGGGLDNSRCLATFSAASLLQKDRSGH